jgi:hypothetical membrane protein
MTSKKEIAGALFFIGVSQFFIGLAITQALYPDYSLSRNYISDLGIGPSAIVFNTSVFLLGLLSLIGTYFLRSFFDLKTINILLVLMSIAAMGVGIFNKSNPLPHAAAASAAFFLSGISAIASARMLSKPFSLISIVLGTLTIGALSLFSIGMVTSGSLTSDIAYNSGFYLGLGPGGIECMMIYPALMWLAAFSVHLAAPAKYSKMEN